MKKIYSLTLLALLCSVGFNSNAQYVDLTGPDNSIQTNYSLDVINGFTIEYLVYITNLQDYNATVSQGADNFPGPIDVYINASGQMRVLYHNGGSQSPNITFEAGKWYHIAHTYNPATSSGYLYINGALMNTFTGMGAVGNTNSTLFIGD